MKVQKKATKKSKATDKNATTKSTTIKGDNMKTDKSKKVTTETNKGDNMNTDKKTTKKDITSTHGVKDVWKDCTGYDASVLDSKKQLKKGAKPVFTTTCTGGRLCYKQDAFQVVRCSECQAEYKKIAGKASREKAAGKKGILKAQKSLSNLDALKTSKSFDKMGADDKKYVNDQIARLKKEIADSKKA